MGLLLIACAAVYGNSFAQAPAFHGDHGTFEISLHGARVGAENFEIRSRSGGVNARADASLDVSGTHFETSSNLDLGPDLNPLVYRWSQSAPQKSSLQITFSRSGASARYNTVHGRRDLRQFQLPPDTLILDDNSVYQYEVAAMRYDRAGGGTQTFHALIPQEAIPGAVTMQSEGVEKIDVGDKLESCRHLALTTELARIDLWMNSEDHLEKMEIAASGLVAVRRR